MEIERKIARVELVGGVSLVCREGERLTQFRTLKMVALLGILALKKGASVSREELTEWLWPGQAPAWQKARLRNELSLLVQLTGGGVILRQGRTALSLDPSVATDVGEFEERLQAAEATPLSQTERLRLLREAVLQVPNEDLMPGFYEDPILSAREYLSGLYLDALSRLVLGLEAQGRNEETYRWRRMLLARFPDEAAEYLGVTPTVPLTAQSPRVSPLPTPPSSRNRFFGRNTEKVRIRQWRETKRSPLLTITGPPGVGKSRLSCEAFPDATFVSLASLPDGTGLYDAIRLAWGMEEKPGLTARQAVLERLCVAGETAPILLLDNFEQIVAQGAPLLSDLIAAVPGIRVVVTSRLLLEIEGEEELHLSPLSAEAAEQLFLERALSIRHDFAPSQDIPRLCRLLDHLPLALELAAARALTMTTHQILEGLNDRFRFLISHRRTTAPQHRSLAAALDWSIRRLEEPIRQAFASISIFPGGFTLVAAAAVLEIPVWATADLLERLRAASLLVVTIPGIGKKAEARYDLLVSLREWGSAMLEPVDAETIRGRHARHFVDLALSSLPSQTVGMKERFRAWDHEWQNFRLALAWLSENDPLDCARLSEVLCEFWESRGMNSEGVYWCDRAANGATSLPALAAQLRVKQSQFLFHSGEFDQAEAAAMAARTIAESCGAEILVARANRYLGHIAMYQGSSEATGLLDLARDQFRAACDEAGECETLHTLGILYICNCDFDIGRDCLKQAAALARRLGDIQTALMSEFFVADAYLSEGIFENAAPYYKRLATEAERDGHLLMLAYVDWGEGIRLMETGLPTDGAKLLRRSLRYAFEEDQRWATSLILEALSYCFAALRQWENAARLLGAAEALRSAVRFPRTLSYVNRHERYISRVRAALTDLDYNLLYEEGAALPLAEAVALGLTETI